MLYPLPALGSSGTYVLDAPFNTKILDNERLTCKAIRKMSDLVAKNIDVHETIYKANGVDDAIYEEDVVNDIEIVSLQSDVGHWLDIPARFIIKYPIVNGVAYRSFSLVINLPQLPVNNDISFINTELEEYFKDSLGVNTVTKLVETSRVIMVDNDLHIAKQNERNMIKTGEFTYRSKYVNLLQKYNDCLVKIGELEQYILANYVP
jgi:hypothetical protein